MSTPTLDELFQDYQSLRFAESGWLDGRAAAERLAGPDEVGDAYMRRVLEVGMGVCYARPFSKSNGVKKLKARRWRPDDPALAKQHWELIDLRHKVWAHTDADSHQRMVRYIRAEEIPGHDYDFWAMQWDAPTAEELPVILALFELQLTRAKAEAEKVGALLETAIQASVAQLDEYGKP